MSKKKSNEGWKKKGKKTSFNKPTLINKILSIFNEDPGRSLNYKQLANLLHVTDANTRKLINACLIEMAAKGDLIEIHRGKFKLKTTGNYITGKVDLTAKGSAYIVSDEIDRDVFVAAKNLNHALHDDVVRVYVYALKKRNHVEGEVVEILKRKREVFVGVIEVSQHFAFLIPERNQMPFDIFIPLDKLKKAKSGQKAIAKIIEWPENQKNPIGEVVEVLGMPGENEVEMHAILAEFGLPYAFPQKVLDTAERIPEEITEEEIAQRRDFRNITTFTIDPFDAKDFDDAISYQKLKNGNIEVGIHIADVTHYVRPNTVLEKEAYERATSVYLVDRVVPMLPERLSNFICSLRPNEDKLCFSTVVELDTEAHVINSWIGRTIINSDCRFTYEEAQEIIETGEGNLKEEMLALHQLAQKLRAKRFQMGSIAFERSEVKFQLDDKARPIGVYLKENKESNQLVEEFMLLANRQVAEFVGKPDGKKTIKTFVYRVHDEPNKEKLNAFAHFIKRFGYQVQTKSPKKIAESMNQLLVDVQGRNEQTVVETLAIRTMAKAEYSTKNLGHYGLSFDYYSHFTSPIRRYPDMMVHRLLEQYLKGGKSAIQEKYEEMCKHASDMEQLAATAERSSIKYKQVEFMKDNVGKEYRGVISGVTQWGIYVELNETKCEGMIPVRSLTDDFYEYDEAEFALIGERNKKRFTMGDSIAIRVVSANLAKKQLDFELAPFPELV
ncbi:MAG: ribonuclease R [Bacteroidetes bacterium HGW-Bacteroidetes-4]|jgi:ribonuclease R|nr:MAG: ribonuclease R [Bacteroidetes bacterium HGW-Bacteroidetes-4]